MTTKATQVKDYFPQLIKDMEDCEHQNIDCDACPHMAKCLKWYDNLASSMFSSSGHSKLRHYALDRERYTNLKKNFDIKDFRLRGGPGSKKD